MVRVYHYLFREHGLENLRQRRLKISRLNDLNDPFELWAMDLTNSEHRQAFVKLKNELGEQHGLLCFSFTWQSPLMWSHYADRHRGLVLGFDIPEELIRSVSYSESRLKLRSIDEASFQELLFTKYKEWEYEKEARIYAQLSEKGAHSPHYFADFCDSLRLREVIAGPLCDVRETELSDAAGSIGGVHFKKTRLAFGSFKVVADQRGFPV